MTSGGSQSGERSATSVFSGDEFSFSMPSRLEYLSVIDKLVEGIIEACEIDEEPGIALATSVIEACTNAIQHGHKHDPSKFFSCRFEFASDRITVTVTDSGAGFDLDKVLVSDPTGPEGIMKSRGRGIFIMKTMMDEVDFSTGDPTGTVVHLVKFLTDGPGSGPGV